MFVAVFESLFHVRLKGIIRNPYSTTDYVINASLVIEGLSHQIQMDLQHIGGESIVNGDIRSLSNLIHILYRCVDMAGRKSRKSRGMARDLSLSFSSDSISTHNSAFIPGDIDGNLRTRFSLGGNLEPRTTQTYFTKERKDKFIDSSLKNDGMWGDADKRATRERWFVDNFRSKEIHYPKSGTENQMMLRKVYLTLYLKTHSHSLT
jgi:Domain of unknown function (DUF5745)